LFVLIFFVEDEQRAGYPVIMKGRGGESRSSVSGGSPRITAEMPSPAKKARKKRVGAS
jgi:hypothetical protein